MNCIAPIDNSAAVRLPFSIAFPRLRMIASALLRRERPEHSLQPTALVNESFLKLHKLEGKVLGEEHFFRLAARAMRQVLIDHARARGPIKQSGLDDVSSLLTASSTDDPESAIGVRKAFRKLQRLDPKVAESVWLRCVEQRTIAEVSRIQKRDPWRVREDYEFGVQCLAKWLTE